MPWKLTVRAGSKVQRTRYERLDDALEQLEERARQLARDTSGRPVDTKLKRFEPVQQVAARLELAGPERLLPSRRAGLDVRGNGSVEAYRGGLRRELLDQRPKETPYGAIRRELTPS